MSDRPAHEKKSSDEDDDDPRKREQEERRRAAAKTKIVWDWDRMEPENYRVVRSSARPDASVHSAPQDRDR